MDEAGPVAQRGHTEHRPATGEPNDLNLAENLDRTARARGGFASVNVGDQVTSFGEVGQVGPWCGRVAGFLADNGLRAGDRVGLVLPDVLEYAALSYGIIRFGAVVRVLDDAFDGWLNTADVASTRTSSRPPSSASRTRTSARRCRPS